jgi:hypothetical protein
VYSHAVGSSITGGYVVRDPSSELAGRYVFGDFVNGRIWVIATDSGATSFAQAVELTATLDAGAAGAIGNVASFGEGPQGQLFIVDYGGKVVQVVPEPPQLVLMALGLAVIGRRACRTSQRRPGG